MKNVLVSGQSATEQGGDVEIELGVQACSFPTWRFWIIAHNLYGKSSASDATCKNLHPQYIQSAQGQALCGCPVGSQHQARYFEPGGHHHGWLISPNRRSALQAGFQSVYVD